MPMKRSGRSVAAASLVIEIDEVLVAMQRARLQRRAEILQDLELQLLVLGRRLDHEVASGQLRLVGRSDDAPQRGFPVGRASSSPS